MILAREKGQPDHIGEDRVETTLNFSCNDYSRWYG